MGCTCGKETISVGNKCFLERSRLGEGHFASSEPVAPPGDRGFSYVDLVEDRSSRRLFALKRLACHSDDDVKTARREAEYMLGLRHRNLVPCDAYAVNAVAGSRTGVVCEVLIVMPYYKKGSIQDELESLRRAGGGMEEGRLLRILRGVCEGVRALHTHYPLPLTHRDIKPANIMLDVDDTPVLMDFGSMGPATVQVTTSKQARAIEETAAERCSMPYRAPELFHVDTNSVINDRIDIWSLGCTVYALCYLESPFDRAYQRGDSIALAVLGANVHLPETPIYRSDVTDLILAALVVNPDERPPIDVIIQRIDAITAKHSHIA